MRPGSCGILDDSGFWSLLFDLNDDLSLSSHGLGPSQGAFEELREAGITWGPKLSDGASMVCTGISVGTPIA
jgi:hypothetical protein